MRGTARDRDDEPGGPPYRAIAMVLLTAVVAAIAIGLVQLFGGSSDDDTTQAAQPQSQTSAPAPAGGAASPAGQPPASPAPGAPGAPATPGQEPAQAPAGESAAPGAGASGGAATPAVPVHILNNSTVAGLAGRTGDQLRSAGFDVQDVANLPSNQGVVPQSAAYYGTGPGEQEAAQAVAARLGIQAQPRPAELAPSTPGVIVIVTQDLQR